MPRKNTAADRERGAVKDPDQWTTGGEPMTGAQESYLNTLAREAGEPIDPELTKAEASKKIEGLQQETGRGSPTPARRPRKKAGRGWKG